jgi:hypothetical protein
MSRSIHGASLLAASLLALSALASPARAQQHEHGQPQQGQPQGAEGGRSPCAMMEGMNPQPGGGMGSAHGGDHGAGAAGGAAMGMSGAMSGGMHAAAPARPGPGALLDAADRLGLTPEQREGLAALEARFRTEHAARMDAAGEAHALAAAALEGKAPSLDLYERELRAAAEHGVAAHVSLARAAVEAAGLLTPEQRVTLESVVPDGGGCSCCEEGHGSMEGHGRPEQDGGAHGSGH